MCNNRRCNSLGAPDDERKYRTKHVEYPRNNKICYAVESCWSFSYIDVSLIELLSGMNQDCRSQWPCGLRRRCTAARLLRSQVCIPMGAWMFVCCECCVLSGRGLCDELITRPEESYRLWCVVVCDLENLNNEKAMTRVGSQRHSNKKKIRIGYSNNKEVKLLKGTSAIRSREIKHTPFLIDTFHLIA